MELDTASTATGKEVAIEFAPSGELVLKNQPQPVGDGRLAAILAKKDRGEKLDRSESGYLGGIRRAAKPVASGNQPAASRLPEQNRNPENPLFELEAEPAGGPKAFVAASALPLVDSAAIRKAAGAILDSVDLGTKIYVGYEAKQAGGDKQTIEQWKSAVALQSGNRDLMLEGSEPIVLWLCEKFKCEPDQLEKVLKNSGFIGGAFMHFMGVATAVKAIRESKKEKQANQPPAKT